MDSSNEMMKSSASPTGSIGGEDEKSQKKAILEYGNSSILHGYDFAIELLNLQGFTEAANVLSSNRKIMEVGLKNGYTG
jgi:hypothetical protein